MNKNTIPISVCIPCIPRDTPKLKRCLDSIENQTCIPSEVIIGHSEMNDNSKNKLLDQLKSYSYSFNIVISNIPGKGFAGKNRNRAAMAAKEKYISFFDSDDTMHRQRLQIIYELFEKYNVNCIVHCFYWLEKDYNLKNLEDTLQENKHISYEDKDIVKGDILYQLYKKTQPFRKGKYFDIKKIRSLKHLKQFHHGHCSIKKEVIKKVKQREEYSRSEDTQFINDIFKYYNSKIEKNNVILFIPKELSYYKHSKDQN